MKVKDFFIRCSSIDEKDSISKALGMMKKYKLKELPVTKDNRYSGILYLKDIVTRNVDIINTSVKTLKANVPSVTKEDSVENIISLIFESGLTSIPVINEKIDGIIRQRELVDTIPENKIKENMDKIISPCITAYENDLIGKIKNMMKEENISRVVIINNDKKMSGIIRTEDLIKSIKKTEKEEQLGDIMPSEKMEARGIISSFFICEEKKELTKIKEKIKKYGDIVLTENGTPTGIITEKDIIKLGLQELSEELPVRVTGLKNEDEITKHEIDEEINNFIQKIGKFAQKMQYLFIDVERFHTGGGRIEYSIKAKLRTSEGIFIAKTNDWDLISSIQNTMKKLEKSVKKKHEKIVERR